MKFIIVFFVVILETTSAQDCTEAPRYSDVRPFSTSAVITLLAGNTVACEIEEAIVSCTNDGTDQFERTINISDDDFWLIMLQLRNLEPETVYTCYVRYPNSPNTGPIRFRTRDLVRIELNITGVTESAFKASWIEDYDPDFVLGYQLEITLGPSQHIFRSDCKIDRPSREIFNFGKTVSSFVFDNGLPNFIYSAQLAAIYDLAISELQYLGHFSTIYLEPAEPAEPEELSVDFRCEEETGYNVTAVISWMAPCELNGELSSFDLSVEAIFAQGGDVGVEYTTSIPAISPDHRHQYELPELSPLFRYVVTVNTVAAFRGPGTEIHITPPDISLCNN